VTSDGSAKAGRGRVVDVGPVLDEGCWTPYQKRVLALVSFTIVLDGFDTQTLSLAIPTLIREWGISRAPFGIVLAFGYVAMALGTVLGGMLGDRRGRRFALLASMIVFGLGTLAGAFANDVAMMGLSRAVACLGLGAAMPTAAALAAEYTPRRNRSLALGIAMGSIPVGGFLGGLSAAYILSHGSWRDLFVVSGLIPLAGAVLLAIMLPESIRFLVGRCDSSRRIALLLRRLGQDASEHDRFVDSNESHAEKAGVRELFTPAYRRDTIVLSSAFFLIIFANLLVVSWTPSLLADLSYSPAVTSTGFALWSIGGLFGAIGGAALFGRAGSRIGLSTMIAGAVVVMLVMSLASGQTRAMGLLCLLLVGGVFIPGSQVMLFALAGQVFPTTIRGTGVGFTAAVGRIGAVASGLAGPLLLSGGSLVFFATVAAAMLISGISLRLMRSEVRATTERNMAVG
jgi:MFS transporter, AAHS family, 4-hydroxybenzoate transporter